MRSDFAPALPSSQTVVLLRGAQPPQGPGVSIISMPIASSAGQSYTIEARRLVSYDDHLPGDAVVIYTIDPTRAEPAWERCLAGVCVVSVRTNVGQRARLSR